MKLRLVGEILISGEEVPLSEKDRVKVFSNVSQQTRSDVQRIQMVLMRFFV